MNTLLATSLSYPNMFINITTEKVGDGHYCRAWYCDITVNPDCVLLCALSQAAAADCLPGCFFEVLHISIIGAHTLPFPDNIRDIPVNRHSPTIDICRDHEQRHSATGGEEVLLRHS